MSACPYDQQQCESPRCMDPKSEAFDPKCVRVCAIRAPDLVPESMKASPRIFLAGPIIGAPDWQKEATELIEKLWNGPPIVVANPRRPGFFSDDTFTSQVEWEHEHIWKTLSQGVMLFWMPVSNGGGDYRSYAKTTRFELGFVFGVRKGASPPADLVVGIEQGFPGARYLRKTFGDKDPSVPIRSSLEDTVRQTLYTLAFAIGFQMVAAR